MKHSDFVHLHNHSDYSLLDGASPIAGLVERAARFEMPALALTDHGAMFGAVEFYQEARKAGVKPIVGMEAYVTRGRLTDRNPNEPAHHLVLLARDERGFKNLMRLSSLAYLEGFYYKPRVDHTVLAAHAEGLLALSACPKGEIASDLSFLRDALNRYLTATAQAKPNILANAVSRLKAMRAEAELYEQPSRADDATRKRLEQILSAREFERVRGPTPLDLLKERLQAWIGKQLRKINPKIPDVQDLGQWFVWGMIALAAAVRGLAKNVRPPLPWRPSKLRLLVETLYSPGCN